ncbi:ankyrin repeat protein-like protein [Plenodomus tracheiphilus IPT5]|uniref:Ankyrin repeat protein-like protein n=1 Tax=Plenodomus tracheiphilus IPT5 TaxID=1408161 RepID=A0A6A7B1E9_9PLEO|nr:ankyrin repeat protein-like protein [Plenodomus tracheiphilus IPT5]
MPSQDQKDALMALPPLPASHEDWIAYVSDHPDTSLQDLITPFKDYDSKLREHVKIRARDLSIESEAERQCYLMPLTESNRKVNGAPAVVQSLKEFQTNFQLFSESSLVDMDWSNVVVAGSAVVTSLLPVPPKHSSSKRALREYYHQKLAPASDVDLFLYGLTEEQAVDKIKQIEQRIKDSILTETTTVRTKNAITIASQYPTRHVQIVLRIYRSVSEILTGFDVDCSCAAYDGSQVYVSPRALAAYMTQINTIDLTRRSPSYENRLSKYSRRGFEVYWPLLDRSRIDPTLFERSFGRTLGLARLLVLEKLPKKTDREAYVDQRREERGRPTINRWATNRLRGNMKEEHDDEVADWVEADDVSDYHTFTIPYGPKYNARKIERLLYAKDLLLNAEWNRPKDRETALHRHPAFFGTAVDIIGDCCGSCPKPTSTEDQEIAEEEAKIYVSGDIAFIKDNPGRQAIGSFHPITDNDWTEMAYVGNTARLCQAIVDGDLEHVQDWLKHQDADPNRRDYTGRTPLHLAVTSSSLEVVQCLIDAGARITARLFDGKTALHLAAMRGETAMVKAILIRSEANEEKEAEKQAKKASSSKTGDDGEMMDVDQDKRSEQFGESAANSDSSEGEDDDIDMLDDESAHVDATTENSVIKIDRKQDQQHETLPEDENQDEPDVYDINVLAWDTPVSALHLAVANGHVETVKILVQDFGADLLLPIKLVNDYNKSARAAIMPLVLALRLAPETAKEMTKVLMSLGASPAQADVNHVTALHYFAAHGSDLLRSMISIDRPAAQRAIHHLAMPGNRYNPMGKSALQTAIIHKDLDGIDVLLELGAGASVDYSTYITSFKTKWDLTGTAENNEKTFRTQFKQPVFTAIDSELPSVVLKLLDAGADINTLQGTSMGLGMGSHGGSGQSLLDAVRKKITELSDFLETGKVTSNYRLPRASEPVPLKADEEYLRDRVPGTYAFWSASKQLHEARCDYERKLKQYEDFKMSHDAPAGTLEKKAAINSLLGEFEALQRQLIERGAKLFKELYPDVKLHDQQQYSHNYESPTPEPWTPSITFQVPDLTDERREAYIKLFQACWDGDLSTVKKLTLSVWGEEQCQSPLRIAVKDMSNFSPFSIAVLREHIDLAKAVLEIAHAQYAPAEKTGQARHTVGPPTREDSDSFDGNEDDFQIYTEIVDDTFTIEDIGAVHGQVKSTVTPLEMISWSCPVSRFLEDDNDSSPTSTSSNSLLGVFGNRGFGGCKRVSRADRTPRKILKDAAKGVTYHKSRTPSQEHLSEVKKPGNLFQLAIYMGDEDLLDFMITIGEDYTVRKASNNSDGDAHQPTMFRFEQVDFLYAVGLGRIPLLQHIIRRTGAGIPLDNLVKRSGVEIAEKPKYYQGLSVHGKKRADWANAGREIQGEAQQDHHPPLLHAARLANLESVEWFLSDAAPRCYMEFANAHQGDIRIQNLGKAKGGLEGSITNWLGLRAHLLIHCVVLHKTTKDSEDLLRHLCRTRPEALENRSSSGLTPLHLAFSLHRVEMIKILIEAGVDQTCRNNARENIVHSMLTAQTKTTKKDENIAQLRELLGLIDARLIQSLFEERTTQYPGASTPLARWLYNYAKPFSHTVVDVSNREKFLQVLLEFSKGEDLSIINAEGDTPVHTAVRYTADSLLQIMLECRPELLFRENATGRTPYEMAEDAYLSKQVFNEPPSLMPSSNQNQGYRWQFGGMQHSVGVIAKEPELFVEKPDKDTRSGIEKVWHTCKEVADRTRGTKRKLVTLVEANEVAKRLVKSKSLRTEEERDASVESGEAEESEEIKGDEIALWYHNGLSADW